MKRLYIFYIDRIKSGYGVMYGFEDRGLEEKYPIYAWTTNDKLAKKFRDSRDMKYFIERRHDYDDDEVVTFGNRNRVTELLTRKLPTLKNDDWENVKMVLTWSEAESLSDAISMGLTNQPIYRIDYEILKDKYIEPLAKLAYTELFDLENSRKEDYDIPNIMFDELALLINMIGYILK